MARHNANGILFPADPRCGAVLAKFSGLGGRASGRFAVWHLPCGLIPASWDISTFYSWAVEKKAQLAICRKLPGAHHRIRRELATYCLYSFADLGYCGHETKCGLRCGAVHTMLLLWCGCGFQRVERCGFGFGFGFPDRPEYAGISSM